MVCFDSVRKQNAVACAAIESAKSGPAVGPFRHPTASSDQTASRSKDPTGTFDETLNHKASFGPQLSHSHVSETGGGARDEGEGCNES